MTTWNPEPTRKPRCRCGLTKASCHAQRRSWPTVVLVAVIVVVTVLGLLWTAAQDADAGPIQGTRCGPVLVVKSGHNQGTLYGCQNGTVTWSPKRGH